MAKVKEFTEHRDEYEARLMSHGGLADMAVEMNLAAKTITEIADEVGIERFHRTPSVRMLAEPQPELPLQMPTPPEWMAPIRAIATVVGRIAKGLEINYDELRPWILSEEANVWRRVIERMRRERPGVAGYVAPTALLELNKETALVGVEAGDKLAMEALEAVTNKRWLERVLSEEVKRHIEITFTQIEE
jgi:hypothetical protein